MPGQPQQVPYGYGGSNMTGGPPVGPQGSMYGWNAPSGGQNQGMMPQGNSCGPLTTPCNMVLWNHI